MIFSYSSDSFASGEAKASLRLSFQKIALTTLSVDLKMKPSQYHLRMKRQDCVHTALCLATS